MNLKTRLRFLKIVNKLTPNEIYAKEGQTNCNEILRNLKKINQPRRHLLDIKPKPKPKPNKKKPAESKDCSN